MVKTILVLSNHPTWTYKLRGEVLQALVQAGCRVIVAVGYGPEVERLKEMGCEYVDMPYHRRSVNPVNELRLLWGYRKLIKKINPDAVLSYTIKPNLYGAYLCKAMKIPCLVNITGLGSALEQSGMIQHFFLKLYRYVFKDVYRVFFQNQSNLDLFVSQGIVHGNGVLLPGSGVNLITNRLLPYPSGEIIEFVFMARILKAKGIEEYLCAAKNIHQHYPQTQFHICGFCDQDYSAVIDDFVKKGIVIYHGMVEDPREIFKRTHCTVLPSWYSEGMNNVLLESAACGRPIITTNRPGCGEIVEDGVNGFIVKPQDPEDLMEKMERFILMPDEMRKAMGQASRHKVESKFDRNIVVRKYMETINSIV
jgi:galacturonosyltransferase